MAINFNPKSYPPGATASQSQPAKLPKLRAGSEILGRFGKPVKSREVMFFTSQLSLMLEIGTPLNIALKAIGAEIQNPAFKVVIAALYQEIEEGAQLSDAMKRHPQIFNQQFISLVKAGEAGGFLNQILNRVVEMQEKRQALITQIGAALTYPVVLCGIGLLVVIFVLVGVLPKFATFFAGKESVLPWNTRFLMLASESLQHKWWLYMLTSTGLVVGLIKAVKSRQGRAVIDRFFISAPLISGLANKIYTNEMLRTLGNLMESGVPLLEALNVTRPTIYNQYYQRFVDQIKNNVAQGGRFDQSFAGAPYIPETVKQMVAIGEEVGKLPFVMLRLAKFYDTEIEQELKKLAAMIEPAALIVMGGVVGLLVSSIILPLFKLSQVLH